MNNIPRIGYSSNNNVNGSYNINKAPQNDFHSSIRKEQPQLPPNKDENSNFFERAIKNLQALQQNIIVFSRAIDLMRQGDQKNGVGVIAGAKASGQQVLEYFNLLMEQAGQQSGAESTNGSKTATSARSSNSSSSGQNFSMPTSFEMGVHTVGSLASKYTQNMMQTEVLNYLGSQLGMDLSKLSWEGVASEAWEAIAGGGTAAAEAAAAGTSAAAGAGEAAAAAAGAEAGAASSALGIGGKVFGAIGAAYSAYQLVANWGKMPPLQGAISGATTGAYIGSIIPGIGTVVGAVIGGVIGAIQGFCGSGKSKEQKARDQVRKFFKEHGVIDDKWCLTLADGSKFDIGKDGGARLKNVDGTERKMHDIDSKNPLAGEAIAMLNPLGYAILGENTKLKDDFMAYFVNAATSNATTIEEVRKNALAIYAKFGMSPDQMVQTLGQKAQSGAFSADLMPHFINGLKMVLGTYGHEAPQGQTEEEKQKIAA